MSLDIWFDDPTATYATGSLFEANITHNLTTMAQEAGIYDALWRPYKLHQDFFVYAGEDEYYFEGSCTITAEMLIPALREGLIKLQSDPEYYKQFNSPNGWGLYEHFVPFVEKVLNACEKYPEAIVDVCR